MATHIIDPERVTSHLARAPGWEQDILDLLGGTPPVDAKATPEFFERRLDEEFHMASQSCKPARNPVFLMTAGSPGAGKTHLLETLLAGKGAFDNFVYTDPNRCLERLACYREAVTSFGHAFSGVEARRIAYALYRFGSHYLADGIMNLAAQNRLNIALGTTATGAGFSPLVAGIREAGYSLSMLLVDAPDHVRRESVSLRNGDDRNFYLPESHFTDKGPLFPRRLRDYFAAADSMRVYWRAAPQAAPVLAAYTAHGKFTVVDEAALKVFIDNANLTLAPEGNAVSWPELRALYKPGKAQAGNKPAPATP